MAKWVRFVRDPRNPVHITGAYDTLDQLIEAFAGGNAQVLRDLRGGRRVLAVNRNEPDPNTGVLRVVVVPIDFAALPTVPPHLPTRISFGRLMIR